MNKQNILHDLFQVESYVLEENSINGKISVNKNSSIYKGHFPGEPVTPGVCEVFILKVLLRLVFPNKHLSLIRAKNIKFISVLYPEMVEHIDVSINFTLLDNVLETKSLIYKDNIVFLKAEIKYALSEWASS